MLDHTKKPPINNVTLLFEGHEEKQREAIVALKSLDFNPLSISDSIPWRDAFPEFAANESGNCLSAARQKKEFTQAALSDFTGISRRHLSEMENGKREIEKITAQRLADILDVDYRVFL